MPWVTSASTDIGGREDQQDRYLVAQSDDGNSCLLVVADGAGGHKMGAAAAQNAIDCISENLGPLWSSSDPDTFLCQLINMCNDRVLAVGGGDLVCSTLVLVFTKGDEIFWGHVGDSRFYLIRNGDVVSKTVDHSMLELERQQTAPYTDQVLSAASNKIYMCLGSRPDITPATSSSLANDGDTLLLCSDGLWGQIDMPRIIADIGNQPLTKAYLSKWTQEAKTSISGNSDNITVIAARFTSKPARSTNLVKAIARFFRQ